MGKKPRIELIPLDGEPRLEQFKKDFILAAGQATLSNEEAAALSALMIGANPDGETNDKRLIAIFAKNLDQGHKIAYADVSDIE